MFQPAQGSTTPAPPADGAGLAALVERARAGDVAAFSALYERFYVPICRYLARLVGDDDLGDDLAQDTFLAAWRAVSGIEDSSYFVPWLYRIASNLARSHLRRARLIRWLPGATMKGCTQAAIPAWQDQKSERARSSASRWRWRKSRPNTGSVCSCSLMLASASAKLPACWASTRRA